MKQNKDTITFEVNETLYFESGQEIAEMLSISLDPEISIQSYDNYVQVRGLIILQGEYVKAEEKANDDITLFNEDLTGYIEKVVDTENNQAVFTHRFPVEISVPPYRVENIKDVTVTIDSFDYEIPDDGKLKVKSTIHINGISADTNIERMENYSEQDVQEKNEQNPMMPGENTEDKEVVNRKEDHVDSNITEELPVEDSVMQMKHSHDQEFVDTTEKKSIAEQKTKEIDIQLNESEAEEEDDEKVKDVRFLTDLFGGEEEESHSKIRIYITQEEDTIESVAKRYEISALQLIKDNNLSGKSIEGGQLLHLPVQSNE